MEDNYFGYKVRKDLYPGEKEYFIKNKNVSGMASEDGSIIFNPHSNEEVNFDSVGMNEAARLWLRENKVIPEFAITQEQKKAFSGTPYEKDELALKHTILGRIISGDQSAGEITKEQKEFAAWLLDNLNKKKTALNKKDYGTFVPFP